MTGTRPVALTIAGSDSGGGAGIQADLKTFHAFGVFGTSAITAVTAQNTVAVTAVHPIPPVVVRAQIDAVMEDLGPAAVKTGMLATAELARTVARALADHRVERYVLDPVMVATSGGRLLEPDAEAAVRTELIPRAALVTPNLDEAGILVGAEVGTVDAMREAARAIVRMGARAALLKGGHLREGEVVDVLWDGKRERVWRHPRVVGADPSAGWHGTGCTLSAAVAAGFALGRPLEDAVDAAIDFVARAIQAAPGLGRGHGPVSHFVGTGDGHA